MCRRLMTSAISPCAASPPLGPYLHHLMGRHRPMFTVGDKRGQSLDAPTQEMAGDGKHER